jgi:hypothetical protein
MRLMFGKHRGLALKRAAVLNSKSVAQEAENAASTPFELPQPPAKGGEPLRVTLRFAEAVLCTCTNPSRKP